MARKEKAGEVCFNVRQATDDEIKQARSMEGFLPRVCMECGNVDNLASQFFILDEEPRSQREEKLLEQVIREKIGVKHFGMMVSDKIILTAAKCPRCGSYEVLFDY